jgi:hypothetical protein
MFNLKIPETKSSRPRNQLSIVFIKITTKNTANFTRLTVKPPNLATSTACNFILHTKSLPKIPTSTHFCFSNQKNQQRNSILRRSKISTKKTNSNH